MNKINSERIFSFVWLDTTFDETNVTDYYVQQIQDELRSTFDENLEIFRDEFNCEWYIRDQPISRKIILITNEVSGDFMIERALRITQVVCTFVYQQGPKSVQHCQKGNDSFKLNVVSLDKLLSRIKAFEDQWISYSAVPLLSTMNFNSDRSTTRVNGSFVFLEFIINIFLEIEPTDSEFHMFIEESLKLFENDPDKLMKLQDFQKNYESDDALFWYSKNYLMHCYVNEALRTENIERLYICRFFLRDLHSQLNKYQCKNSIRVYRGQQMSTSEVEHLLTLINHLVIMKSILSTSMSRAIAELFLPASHTTDKLERVIFEIEAKLPSNGYISKPFANITDHSNFDQENEVLFIFCSRFVLTDMYKDNDIWIVKMSSWSVQETELDPIVDTLLNIHRNTYNSKSTLSFTSLMINMGRDDIAVSLVKRHLFELTWKNKESPNSYELARCYHQLGFVDLKRNQYDLALNWFSKALETFASVVPIGDLSSAPTYISIGDTESRKGNVKRARMYYQTALNIYEREYGIKHTKTIALRDNIVWHTVNKKKSCRQPIDFCLPVCEIDEKKFFIESKLLRSIFDDHQLREINSLPTESVLAQIYPIIEQNGLHLTESDRSLLNLVDFHPSLKILQALPKSFSFFSAIVTYRCPSCKEPVWVYKMFSIFKGSPCFRCIRRSLKITEK